MKAATETELVVIGSRPAWQRVPSNAAGGVSRQDASVVGTTFFPRHRSTKKTRSLGGTLRALLPTKCLLDPRALQSEVFRDLVDRFACAEPLTDRFSWNSRAGQH